MTALTLLEQAKDLDLDVRFIDTLLDRAVNDPAVHPRIIARLLQRRAANAQAWGRVWQTKPLTETERR